MQRVTFPTPDAGKFSFSKTHRRRKPAKSRSPPAGSAHYHLLPCALQTRRPQKSSSHHTATALDVAAKVQPSWMPHRHRFPTLFHAASLKSQKLEPYAEPGSSNVSDIALFVWSLVDDYKCRVGAFIPLIPSLKALVLLGTQRYVRPTLLCRPLTRCGPVDLSIVSLSPCWRRNSQATTWVGTVRVSWVYNAPKLGQNRAGEGLGWVKRKSSSLRVGKAAYGDDG